MVQSQKIAHEGKRSTNCIVTLKGREDNHDKGSTIGLFDYSKNRRLYRTFPLYHSLSHVLTFKA